MARLMAHFLSETTDPITRGRYMSLHVCLRPPEHVSFNIHSFGENDASDISAAEKQRWNNVGEVDAFYEFECCGYLTNPKSLVAQPFSLLVNSLGSSFRCDLIQSGAIGEGWDDAGFVVRLYLALDVTEHLKRILSKPDEQISQLEDPFKQLGRDAIGYDPSGINLRFDIFNLKQHGDSRTSFLVCRLYTS